LEGSQIARKRFSASSFRIKSASRRPFLCFHGVRESVLDFDQTLDSQLFHDIQKPLHRSRGFDPHAHRAWQRGIKLPHVVAFVLESHLQYLSRCGVQHRQRLLASVASVSTPRSSNRTCGFAASDSRRRLMHWL